MGDWAGVQVFTLDGCPLWLGELILVLLCKARDLAHDPGTPKLHIDCVLSTIVRHKTAGRKQRVFLTPLTRKTAQKEFLGGKAGKGTRHLNPFFLALLQGNFRHAIFQSSVFSTSPPPHSYPI